MNNNDINAALSALSRTSYELENMYIENEGECTEQTTDLEEQITAIQMLLTTEGVDSLGRWLKAKEDEKKSLKAEKDYITRRMTAIDNTIDYIKGQVYNIMSATGTDKIKGSNGYSFAPTISETTSVDQDALNERYAGVLLNAIRELNVPDYINVKLSASSAIAKGVGIAEGDESLFVVTRKPTARFTKPRASKTTE